MAKKSISDLLDYSLFILDLDNTIYNEEDYLFQAYSAICERFEDPVQRRKKKILLRLIMNIYHKEGRVKLFDKFLAKAGIDNGYLNECLDILRNFTPPKQMKMYKKSAKLIRALLSREKKLFVLTNGNPAQQRNKIKNVRWEGLDDHITFIFADEIESKPSPAGIRHIQRFSGIGNDRTVFIGDSETDRECAGNAEIKFVNIASI